MRTLRDVLSEVQSVGVGSVGHLQHDGLRRPVRRARLADRLRAACGQAGQGNDRRSRHRQADSCAISVHVIRLPSPHLPGIVPARNRYPCRHRTCLCERSTGTRTVAAHRKRWHSPVMKAGEGRITGVPGRASTDGSGRARSGRADGAVGRLISGHRARGGAPCGRPAGTRAVGAVAAGAALAAHRTTALCGTLLMLAGPAVVIAAVPVAPARPALLFTIALAGPALAPALLG